MKSHEKAAFARSLSWENGGRIVGIIDYYGAVYSRLAECGEDHWKHFGARMHNPWEYSGRDIYHGGIDAEELDAVKRHLRRKYSLEIE